MFRTDLYFGMNIPGTNGDKVTGARWLGFVNETIVPRFEGFTVAEATGYWKGEREESRVVTIFHGGKDIEQARIDEIRLDYMRRFAQQSVLRADSIASISF